MKNKLIAIACMLVSATGAFSQIEENTQPESAYGCQTGHYLTLDFGGGMNTFLFKANNSDLFTQAMGGGFKFDFNYTYFFTPNWGIGTGIGIRSYQSSATINGLEKYQFTDTDGENYERRTNYNNVRERQESYMLDIPLGIYSQVDISKKWKYMIGFGGRFGLPFSTSFATKSGDIETRGYYSRTNVELYGLPRHGFTTYKAEYDNKVKLNYQGSAFIDMNFLYAIDPWCDFFVGIYAEYGINSLTKANDNHLFAYDAEAKENNYGKYNGILNSNQVAKTNALSVGGQIGFRWRIEGGAPRQKKPKAPKKQKEIPLPILSALITDQATTTPLQDVQVKISAVIQDSISVRDSLITTAKSDSAGMIAVKIKDGSYKLAFNKTDYYENIQTIAQVTTDTLAFKLIPYPVFIADIFDAETKKPMVADLEITEMATSKTTTAQSDSLGIITKRMSEGNYMFKTQKEGYFPYSYNTTNIKDSLHIALQPLPTLTFAVTDKTTKKPLEVIINVTERNSGNTFKMISDEKNGRIAQKVNPGSYDIKIAYPGYMPYSTSILEVKKAPVKMALEPIKKNSKLILNDVLFESGSDVITAGSKTALDNLYTFLSENPMLKIQISGHTDNVGNAKSNLNLSKKRAVSVTVALIERGLDPSRISSKGMGSKEPIASNKTEVGRAKNRRVEMKIM